MIVTQQEIDLILHPKIRRRVLTLPVRNGKRWGERKKCPVRKGCSYTLRSSPPYAQHKINAERQPTRARAVLDLVERCQQPTRAATITVLDVERQDGSWVIRFDLGDQSTVFDNPVYLARYGDFTMIEGKQAVQGDPELAPTLAEDLAKARAKAREARVNPDRQVLMNAKGTIGPLQKSLIDMKARNRLALILKEMDKLADELSVEQAATLPASVCVARQASAAVEGEPRPRDTKSDVHLESAA
ncbi:MAG TPA: hypothetical protein VIC06_14560 [Solirubrobacteraceae bacterium]